MNARRTVRDAFVMGFVSGNDERNEGEMEIWSDIDGEWIVVDPGESVLERHGPTDHANGCPLTAAEIGAPRATNDERNPLPGTTELYQSSANLRKRPAGPKPAPVRATTRG